MTVQAEDSGYVVRLWDPAQQRLLPSAHEATAEAMQLQEQLQQMRMREEEAIRRAQEEARRRAELEARVRLMEEELRRLKRESQDAGD